MKPIKLVITISIAIFLSTGVLAEEKQLVCEDIRTADDDCPSSHQEQWSVQKNYILDTSKLQGATGTLYTEKCGRKATPVKTVYITSTANHLLIEDSFDVFNIDRKTLKGAYQMMLDYGGEARRNYLCKVLDIDTSANKI